MRSHLPLQPSNFLECFMLFIFIMHKTEETFSTDVDRGLLLRYYLEQVNITSDVIGADLGLNCMNIRKNNNLILQCQHVDAECYL